jgi:hypothetical protein
MRSWISRSTCEIGMSSSDERESEDDVLSERLRGSESSLLLETRSGRGSCGSSTACTGGGMCDSKSVDESWSPPSVSVWGES